MKKITLLVCLLAIVCCREKEDIPRQHTFTDAYIEATKGKFLVEIPLAYELSNIIIALEDKDLINSTFIEYQSAYRQEILDFYEPYFDHSLLKKLDLDTDEGLSNSYFDKHYGFRTNSYAFELIGETLVDKELYSRLWNPDLFMDNLAEIQTFIEETNTLDFLEDHASFYQEEIDNYLAIVPVQREWDWLESKFSQRIDAYKIIFSPLTYASHNTRKIVSKNGTSYTEILMFISGLQANPAELGEVQKAYRERVIFTEIDHNYVNPTSDEHLENIKEAMKNLSKWSRSSNYEGAYQVFNEYMTWAVFTLYLKEYYAEADFLEAKKAIEKQMENSRKFLQFGAFNDQLLSIYEANPTSIPDLYPTILEWVKEMDGI